MPSRRDFVKLAALTGYSILVKPGQGASAAANDFVTREEIAPRLEELAPDGLKAGGAVDEPHMAKVDLSCDLLVAGGGLAGVCAALSAARNGSSVVLIQDRSRLGGNASSEVRMHPVGARFGHRETGLIEEFCLENAYHNEHYAWELWDLMLYDYVVREPRIKLLLDSTVYRAEMQNGLIQSVWARCDKTEHLYHIRSKVYMDATGDSRLGLEAGAEFMIGREATEVFNESHASYDTPGTTQGSSILFTSRKHDRIMTYQAPSWARPVTKEDLRFRNVGPKNWDYGYWWIELGGVYDTIRDNERLRFELLAIVLGVWDYIKNSGEFPDAANWALETVGMIPGKRESRRLTGDYVMTQADIEGRWKSFPDAVAFGGWPMDDHPALGFDAPDTKPYRPAQYPEAYNIPLGSLYSKNVGNLMMAGRNISASHVAFTSTRVMKTCAAMGQAAGTAAAMCAQNGILPRELRNDPARMKALQQRLLRDDQTILLVRNEDPDDLARQAAVTASACVELTRPDNLINGVAFDRGRSLENRWGAPMNGEKVWVQLDWNSPVEIAEVQITHDTGLFRHLTMTAAASLQKQIKTGAQPDSVREYKLIGVLEDGSEKDLADVSTNYQRLRRHRFEKVRLKTLRLEILRTNGEEARLYEIRAYA